MKINSYDVKAEFTASLLQSSLSHEPSEIILICWFDAQEIFLNINVDSSCAASYFSSKLYCYCY